MVEDITMVVVTIIFVENVEKSSANAIGSRQSVMQLSKQGEARSAVAEKRCFAIDTRENGRESASAKDQFERCALPDFRRANKNVLLRKDGEGAKI
jgi:hypothetical protein